MRKNSQVFFFLVLLGVMMTEVWASPLEEVNHTRHNLLGPSAKGLETCTVCHTDAIPWQSTTEVGSKKLPESASVPPLWDSGSASVSPFRATQTVPLREQPYNHPTGPSMVCLSCHDGALGTDMHGINVGNPRVGASANAPWNGIRSPRWNRTSGPRESPALSRVDHPISILYPRKPNGVFVPQNPTVTRSRYWALPDRSAGGLTLPTSETSSYLDLPKGTTSVEHLSALVRTTAGKMECDSCHDPHSESVRPFLRVPSKTLCLVCHDR